MANTHTKGVKYEREVADLFTAHGFTVRGLEQAGDHLIICRDGLLLASECKRHERIRLPEWWKQAVDDAPDGSIPLVTFRPSRTRSRSLLWTDDLARLIAR